MDRETAERLTRLEIEAKERDRANEKRISDLEKDHESWNKLLRKVVGKIILWILTMGGAGVFFGLHLPENVRKAIADWIAR
jgi:hypothetical protein